MVSTQSYGSLSGSFRLTGKERASITYMRSQLKMSMNHIAEVLNRSTATIHKAISCAPRLSDFDNRGGKPATRDNRIHTFAARRTRIRVAIRAWIIGLTPSLGESIQLAFSPKGFGELPVNENSPDGDDADPA